MEAKVKGKSARKTQWRGLEEKLEGGQTRKGECSRAKSLSPPPLATYLTY